MAKTKYTKELLNEIVRYIESGATNEDACVMAGIGETTFYKWLSDDEDNPLSVVQKEEFRESMGRAVAKRRSVLANRIIKASEDEFLLDVDGNIVRDKDGKLIKVGRGDWRAAAFYLERTVPEIYAKKEKHEHSGGIDSNISVEELPKEVKDAFRKAFREALRGRKSRDNKEDS